MLKRTKQLKYIIRAVAILLLIIYADQVFNKIFYLHTHMLDSSTVVTHAHPFNKTDETEPYKSHHHSVEQVIYLDNLQFLFLVFFSVLSLLIFASEKRCFIIASSSQPAADIKACYGRAPPAL